MAVVRIWHGKVPIEKADDYERFLIDRAAPDYTSDGLQKLYFLRRNEDAIAHFLLITIWDSLESIKKFVSEPEIAKYYPEDDEFLLEKEKYVSLYEVFYER